MKGLTNAISTQTAVYYTITATAGTGGTITVPSTVRKGDTVTATIAPNTSYSIQSVLVDGIEQGAVTEVVFANVRANHTISATFTQNTHTITVTQPLHGSISPGTGQYGEGGVHIFNLNADMGYGIHTVTYNGTTMAWTANQFATDPLMADATLTCEFTPLKFYITPTAIGNCTITPATVQEVGFGGTCAFNINIMPGSLLESFKIDGVETPLSSTTYIFNDVRADHTIEVKATLVEYDVVATAGANGTISPSGTVKVAHGGNQKFTFTPNTGYKVNTVTVDGAPVVPVGNEYTLINVTSDHTINVTFAVQTYTITPTVSGTAVGTITPATPQTVNHGDDCEFTISPGAGAAIEFCKVDGVPVTLTSTTYKFTNVTADHTIEVSFTSTIWDVTVSAGPNGSVSPSGVVQVINNHNVTLSITPDTGYEIDKILLDGTEVTPTSPTSFILSNVTADHTVAISFKIRTFTITHTVVGNGIITPTSPQTVNYGSDIEFTISPAMGATLNSFIVDGNPVSLTTDKYKFENVTANHTIAAVFSANTYTITASAGANGTINPSGSVTVVHGANQKFTFIPASGYFTGTVTVDGATVLPTAPNEYTFTNVTANHMIHVDFVQTVYTISGTVSTGAITNPTLPQTVAEGGDLTVDISADTGYDITEVKLDGVVQTPIPTVINLTNITANHTIDVTAALKVFSINSSSGLNGTIYPLGSNDYNYGATPTYTWYPDPHYKLSVLKIDGSPITPLPSGNTYTFPALTQSHYIEVQFEQIFVDITPVKSGTGTGIVTPATAHIAEGSSQTFNWAPDISSDVTAVRVNGTPVTPIPTSYTFTNVTGTESLEVEFTLKQYHITGTVYAPGLGTISPTDTYVTHGSNVTITMTPDTHCHVYQFYRDGVLVALTGPNVYEESNVTNDHSYAVRFAYDQYQITTTHSANGSLSPVDPLVTHGDSQTIAFTPDTDYHVSLVMVDGISVTPLPTTSYTFTNVIEEHEIFVQFTHDDVHFTATVNPTTGGGMITGGASQTVPYDGDAIVITVPDTGYKILSYTRPGVGDVSLSDPSFTVQHIISDTNIIVNFEPDTYNISVTKSGTGNGTATVNKSTAHYLESVELTYTPDANSRVTQLDIDGMVITPVPASPYTFSCEPNNMTVDVEFTLNPKITSSSGANGAISPLGDTYVSYGANKSFNMAADTNYTIDTVTVDGTVVTPTVVSTNVWSYEIANVTADHTINVTWKLAEYTIVSGCNDYGSVSPVGSHQVTALTNYTVNFTPVTGYEVSHIVLDGTDTPYTSNSYTFTSVTGPHTITVPFTIKHYTITPTSGANGSITPNTPQDVTHGSSKTFTMTPNAGYTIDTFKIDGTTATPTAGTGNWTYTFTSISADHTIEVTWKVIPVIEFTVLDNSDPTTGFTFPSAYNTEAARTALLQAHCQPALVDDTGAVTHYMTWTDMTHDKTSGATVALDGSEGNVFALWDCAWYKAEAVAGSPTGVKYSFAFQNTSPGTGFTCIAMNGGTAGKAAGMGVFGAINTSGKMMSINSSSNPTVSTTQNNFYNAAINGRTGTFNQNFPTLVAFYKIMLLFEKANKNTQAAYGQGWTKSTHSGACPVNKDWSSSNAWNMNGGSDDNGVTALGVHNFWGNVREFMGEEKCGGTAGTYGFAVSIL